MPPSRAATSAKTAKTFQRKQSLAQAKSIGNKFTEKQSRFECRREEEQVRASQQQRGTSFSNTNEISIGDGLLANKGAWRRQDGALNSFSNSSTEAPSPFEIASRGKRRVSSGDATTFTTQSSAIFGMGARPLPRPPVVGAGAAALSSSAPAVGGTRTTRRVARFNLSDGAGLGDHGTAVGGALGQQRARETGAVETAEGVDHLLREGAGEEPNRKRTRAERFREVVSNSRSHRAQLQRERAGRDAEAVALDEELKGLLHLLPKRNKDAEEREAFARAGTPEVRALLASYRTGHTAKRLTLKSSGAYAITALEATKASVRGEERGESRLPAATPSSASLDEMLDEPTRALLARIRKGGPAAVSTEEAEVAMTGTIAPAPAAAASRQAKVAEAEAPVYAEDDFDVMLNQMRMDTRRAHAADRLLDDEEAAALAEQQLLLEEDRRAVPELGLAARDQQQLARGEWVRQGGDVVYHMDAEGDPTAAGGVYDDNVDIPSSYEGDSDDDGDDGASVREAGSADGKGEDGGLFGRGDGATGSDDDDETGDGTAAASSRSAVPVVGSATLDRLLSEVEALASAGEAVYASPAESQRAAEQRQQRFMQVLLQLHAYARTHVVEVANTFRLVLIEAERSFLRGQRRALSRPVMLSLAVIANLFPMSDYRHEVATPFYIFLCSTLMQMRLDTMESVHCYVGLCALLTQSIRGAGGKFVGESVTALLNVLALQLPRSAIEPVRYQGLRLPIPMVERCEAALLAGSTQEEAPGAERRRAQPWRLLETHPDPEQLLLCAYHQLSVLADLYSPMPAFPVVMLQPFLALDVLLTERVGGGGGGAVGARLPLSAAVAAAHAELRELLQGYAADAEARRAPLAMRTYRPRPIRLFEPLLEEREESAVKTELRDLKKEIREDKKRVMRQLAAETTVHRRAKEKEQAMTEAERERRMHQVMGALQQQQHMMNTVDAIMAKAKSKSKKGISGAPKQSSSEGGSGDVPEL